MITIVASAKEKVIPYGVCNLSPDGRLKNIKEKPKFSFLAISGIYCVNPKILKFIPKNKKFGIQPKHQRQTCYPFSSLTG